MARNSQNLPYVVMGGIIIIGIVLIFTVLIPQYQAANTAQASLLTINEQRSDRRAFLQDIDRKIADLQSQALHERELGVVLPDNDSRDDALRIIDRAASASGVTIARISDNSGSLQSQARVSTVRGEATNLPTGTIPLGVNVAAVGNYLQFRQFLDILATSVRLIDVTRVEFDAQPLPGGQIGELVSLEMDAQFYYQEPFIATDK